MQARRENVKKAALVLAAAVLTVGLTVTGALAKTAKKSAKTDVCFLMPDTKTSIRWVQYDAPSIVKALKGYKVSYIVENSLGDPQKQKAQADQCISSGAKVLIIAPIDSGSASAIEKNAAAKGVKSIDYDRQVEGGVASIYLSFDNHKVGVLQGQGVVNGLKANGKYSQHPVVAELNGGREDANSFLFKGGYDSVLGPLYKNGTFKKGPDQFTPGWDNPTGGKIFAQMLVKTGNKIDALAVANDGLANAAIVALKTHKLKPIPMSGQDASPQGIQNIISGWQTMTVFKDVRILARVAAKAAVDLLHGKTPKTTGTVVTKGRSKEPAYLIAPQAITKANYKTLFTSGFMKKSDVCNGDYTKYCK